MQYRETLCPCCKKHLAEDGRCYNNECTAYDPLSQYFDGPSKEDLEANIKLLNEQIKLLNEQIKNDNFTSENVLPF